MISRGVVCAVARLSPLTRCLCQRRLLAPRSVPVLTRLRETQGTFSSRASEDEEEREALSHSEEQGYRELVNRYLRVAGQGHQVLVVQPYVKWGPDKRTDTTPELRLQEAASLIVTLNDWQVVQQLTVPIDKLKRKMVFGTGNVQKLADMVKQNKQITAVFISVNILKRFQRIEFEKLFKVPVYDRYTIVIEIFKEHAVTKEAKLQVALAEIPYLWNMMAQDTTVGMSRGSGESPLEVGRRVLSGVEAKLRTRLDKVQDQRALSRRQRLKMNIPIIAVVGYTNSGKTSLIKALTGESSLKPRDVLFATLDVTAHAGLLPCRLRVLYMDTVGFMADLPAGLVQCFNATLEDVLLADVIVHICDLSHPDVSAQTQHVLRTLHSLQVREHVLENMITVGNKCDKKPLYSLEEEGIQPIRISATALHGTGELVNEIEKNVMQATERQTMVVRVASGGDEARWLHKETAVVEEWADPDNSQFLMLKVVISKVELAKFRKYFITDRKKS